MKNAAGNERSGAVWKDLTRWLGAGAVVLMAHAAGAYAIHASQPEMAPDGEPPAAIMMELDPMPQAPEVEENSVAPMAEASQNPQEAEAEPEKPVEQVEEVKPPEPVEEPEDVAESEPVEETVPEVPEAPKPEVVLPKKVEKPVAKKPEPKLEKPKKQPKPKEQAKKTVKAETTQQAAAPQINAQNSTRVAANTNRQSSASAGVSSARWQSKVQAHLERKKRAAQRSLGRGAKGVVQVAFVIDASGNVLSARVSGSSGNAQIDQAAVDAVKRASPVPAPPPAMAAARIPFAVPFKFN
ncbi:TonB family protein [Pseudochrobactrum sp. MP213Fo]|uniref:energy transducer TonB n=1 Tax=Pseudochrobactrum sp. MP213Fo TaxID=3022250 RepID=UPI003B9FD08F